MSAGLRLLGGEGKAMVSVPEPPAALALARSLPPAPHPAAAMASDAAPMAAAASRLARGRRRRGERAADVAGPMVWTRRTRSQTVGMTLLLFPGRKRAEQVFRMGSIGNGGSGCQAGGVGAV